MTETPRITLPVIRVFNALRESGQPTSGYDLTRQAGVRSSHVYRYLTELVDAGWAQRQTDNSNPRTVRHLYSLTTKGLIIGGKTIEELTNQSYRPRQQP